jgi:endonuclease YncB( thermonuclease family)
VRPALSYGVDGFARFAFGQRRFTQDAYLISHGGEVMAKPRPGAVPAVFFTRRAYVVSVIDGDTVSVDVDCGFHTRVRMACRLAKIDAPEKNTLAGQAAKAFLSQILLPGTELVVDSITIDKYGGRFDAIVWKVETGENIAEVMVRNNHAQPWIMGKAPKPYKL